MRERREERQVRVPCFEGKKSPQPRLTQQRLRPMAASAWHKPSTAHPRTSTTWRSPPGKKQRWPALDSRRGAKCSPMAVVTHGTRHTANRTQYTAHGTGHTAQGTRHTAQDVWSMKAQQKHSKWAHSKWAHGKWAHGKWAHGKWVNDPHNGQPAHIHSKHTHITINTNKHTRTIT
jgi:hypothetical protein